MAHRSKRFLRSAALAGAVVVAALTAGGAPARTQPATGTPYQVGSTNQLTGVSAVIGRPFISGAATYFKWRNDNGGANGHPIQLTALDDQQNPDRGIANAKRLISEGTIALLAPAASMVGIPMLPVVREARVPMVAYTGVEQMMSDPYYYSIGLDGTHSMLIQAGYLKTKAKGMPRVAFFMFDTPASAAAREATIKLITGWGWQVVGSETFPPGVNELNPQALKLAEAKPDFIISALTDGMSPIAIPLLQRAGVKAPVVNFQAGNSESSFKTLATPQFLAVREFVDPSEPGDATKDMRAAAAKYGTTADMTSNAFTKGWVAAQVIAAALDTCGDGCTGEKVKQALDNMSKFDTKGLGPTVSFSATKKLGVTAGRLYQWDAAQGRAVAVTDLVEAEE